MVRVRLIGWEKVYVLPASQPNPNIPKIRIKIFVTDYNEALEVDADWSDVAATRKANVVKAVKQTLASLYDEVKGEYEYDPSTGTITKAPSTETITKTSSISNAPSYFYGIKQRIRSLLKL